MTRFRLSTTSDQSMPRARGVLMLDWFTGAQRRRSTIEASTELLAGLAPSGAARDLFLLGGAVYCADKLVRRASAPDAWTRELELSSPVRSPVRWRRVRFELTEALSFLSGDRWQLTFRSGANEISGRTTAIRPDAVCLFSGGLDSLAGAIDLLEQGRDVILVGHFESGFVGGVQATLARRLKEVYGDRVRLRQLKLGPAAPNALQRRPLPEEREITTRARSFLFITAGIAVASAFGDDIPLYIPENGFIGINVPFVASRAGTLSTRTTHPHFLARLVDVLTAVGIDNALRNPYRLLTKGEALAECANPDLLRTLAAGSISCAHPESARWEKRSASNCGYCYPCLIRRASLHRVGLDDAEGYRHDALKEAALLDQDSGQTGADLRAVVRGLARRAEPTDILRNGAVPAEDAVAFDAVYRRGRDELMAWFSAGAGAALRRALGLGRVVA